MSYLAQVGIAPGNGRLARRGGSVLFIPETSNASDMDALVDAYLESTIDQAISVADSVIAEGESSPPFVFVAWGDLADPDTSTLQIMVRGAADVSTDLISVPTLSGAGAATWVEHRVPGHPTRASINSGDPVLPGTTLDDGIVPAGGFSLSVIDDSAASLDVAAPDTTPDGIGDHVDHVDHVDRADHVDRVGHDGTGSALDGADLAHLTHARICPAGHLNPPHLSSCRHCDVEIVSEELTIEQPVVARAALSDGRSVDLTGTHVFGRRPQIPDGVDGSVDLVALDAPTSVSRTHLLLRADGWALTATDCNTSGGTALITAADSEPIALLPGVPHEVDAGDTIYLGGPTMITILDV